MLFGKRGVEKQWFYLFEMVMAGLIIAGLIIYAFGIANNNLLERNYFARDLALLTTTIHASPGELNYVYQTGDYDFEFSLTDKGIVQVKDSLGGISEYPAILNNNLNAEPWSLKKPYAIEFIKSGSSVKAVAFSKEDNKNAADEFNRFVAWADSRSTSQVICRSFFVFDEMRMKQGYFIVVHKNGVVELFKEDNSRAKLLLSAEMRNKGALAAASSLEAVDLAFSDYENSIQEFAIAPAGKVSSIKQSAVFTGSRILILEKEKQFVWSPGSIGLEKVSQC